METVERLVAMPRIRLPRNYGVMNALLQNLKWYNDSFVIQSMGAGSEEPCLALRNRVAWDDRRVLFTVHPERDLPSASAHHVTQNHGFFCWPEYNHHAFIFVEGTPQWRSIRNDLLVFAGFVNDAENAMELNRRIDVPLDRSVSGDRLALEAYFREGPVPRSIDSIIHLFKLLLFTMPGLRASKIEDANGHDVIIMWHPGWRVKPLEKTVAFYFSTHAPFPIAHGYGNLSATQDGVFWWRWLDSECFCLSDSTYLSIVTNWIENAIDEWEEEPSVDSVIGQYMGDSDASN